MADSRDDLTWIAVELTKFGEQKIDEGTLAESLRRDLGVDDSHEVFIPAIAYKKGRRNITIHLMEGYVFVASGLPETDYFSLERRPYCAQVLSTLSGPGRMRVLSAIPDKNVRDMKQKLRELASADIPIGARVRVTDGTYRALEGIVLGLDGDHAAVQIDLRSLHVIANIPRYFLETLDTSHLDGEHDAG